MEIEMIVEIPQGSRNKYEMDHDTGAIWLDRTLFTATQYPLDYGFFPHTLGETAIRSTPSFCCLSQHSLAATCGLAPLACSG